LDIRPREVKEERFLIFLLFERFSRKIPFFSEEKKGGEKKIGVY
jgi:hypothetical protein